MNEQNPAMQTLGSRVLEDAIGDLALPPDFDLGAVPLALAIRRVEAVEDRAREGDSASTLPFSMNPAALAATLWVRPSMLPFATLRPTPALATTLPPVTLGITTFPVVAPHIDAR